MKKYIRAIFELVEKADMKILLEQLESTIKMEKDERKINLLTTQTDGKLMECMISAEKKVQPSALARSHLRNLKLVMIQKKAGLLKNLLMVANV